MSRHLLYSKKTDKGKKLQNYPQMWRLYVIEGFSCHNNYTALKTIVNEGSTPWPLEGRFLFFGASENLHKRPAE